LILFARGNSFLPFFAGSGTSGPRSADDAANRPGGKTMSDNVTPIKGKSKQCTSVNFRDIQRPTMNPETAMHSMQALFVAIKELMAGDAGTFAGEVQSLAALGEHIADELTDRL
jgi:hypothetical protein